MTELILKNFEQIQLKYVAISSLAKKMNEIRQIVSGYDDLDY